jgi:tripartite motif-containing protein 2/3/tripartite motif-containing protein 71
MAGEKLDKLAREITCNICNQHYNDPRVLPCCHYYCLTCLKDLLETSGTITCPRCSAVASNLEQLPPALIINHLKMIHARIAKLEEGDSVQCEMCLDPTATAFCEECDEFICSACLASHQKMRAKFQGHKTFSLQDLKNGTKAFPNKHMPLCECPEHNELYKLYCFDCCCLICRDCIVIEHAHHHYEFVAKSVETTRKSLATNLAPLKQLLSNFTESAKLVSDTKNEVTAQGVFVAKHIHERFTAMIELLKVREAELLKKTETVMKKKLSRLNRQEQDLHKSMNSIMTVLDYVSNHLEIISDEELLIIQHQLYSNIEDTLVAHKGVRTVPSDAANLAVKIHLEDVLTEACQDRAQVYLFPQHKKSHVHMAEINKTTVQFVTYTRPPHDLDSTVSAQLVSDVDGSTVEASIFKGGRGLYEVTYTPKVRGRHWLHVTVNGDPIPNSPLPVFINIPPELLGPHPSHVISGIKHPYGALFDKEQNLLVTESNGTQVCHLMRNQEGKISNKRSTFADMGSTNPSGIAADEEGNVYVTSASGHSITKYSKMGQCLASRELQGTKLGEMTHPCGLHVIDKEVFVCDRNNCRIQVFNHDLQPLRAFGVQGRNHGEFQWPYDITQDNGGCVYVSDCDNHRIQVFDKKGKFLHMFGARGAEKSKIKRPMGMTVSKDGCYIFVSEYDNHRVSIYRTDGTYVSSFGHYGNKSGGFCYPVGLVFDSNGFLYVCDQGNNRIQVF